jgi:hypothetical protein
VAVLQLSSFGINRGRMFPLNPRQFGGGFLSSEISVSQVTD